MEDSQLTPTQNQSLVFAVNGERFELSTVDPSTTLLQFLRSHTRFKSVKLGCGEGGCGACNVLLSKFDPNLKQVKDYKISSCLTLLCSINGCSITTTEGLGNLKDGFHSIHQRFAGFHASQCGFCTPGMCMSLFSALINSEKTHRPEPAFGFSKLTVSEAEKSISGNLCRCTGYRPIADVCKSFAADVDIEDLGLNSFWKKDAQFDKLPFYDSKQIITYPVFLKKEFESTAVLNYQDNLWFSPLSIDELISLVEYNSVDNDLRVKLVAGNTGIGYYKETDDYDRYIDLRFIPELSKVKRSDSHIEIGATVSISKLILALKEERINDDPYSDDDDMVFKKIASHLEKIASESIRNVASIGGNLVMAQRKNFPSDIATVLLAVRSKVTILTGVKRETLTLEEFLEKPALDSRTVLLSVMIPSLKQTKNGYLEKTNMKILFQTYRASPRPLGNALAYLNAAFLAETFVSDNGVGINSIQLAFGSFWVEHAIRARTVESYLVGKTLSADLIYEAVKLIRVVISPEYGTSHSDYRSSLAVSYLFDFLFPLVEADGYVNPFDDSEKTTLLSSSKQVIETSNEHYPVGEPIVKSGAAIQASGLYYLITINNIFLLQEMV